MRRLIRRLTQDAAAVVLLLSFPLLFLAAIWPLPWLFAAVVVVSFGAEYGVRRSQAMLDVFDLINFGTTLRFVLREVAALVLAARVLGVDSPAIAILALGIVGLHGLRAVQTGLALFVVRRRALPAVTRNVDLSALNLADAPPALLTEGHILALLYLDVPAVAGAVAAALTGDVRSAAAGAVIALALSAAVVLATVPYARRSIPLSNKDRMLRLVQEKVIEYDPEIALVFSGPPDGIYQVNMWLSTLERLDRRAIVILRERNLLPELGRTSLPVVCVPGGVDLMSFELPHLRVALYAANVGKNIHMLRVVGMKHVFVGHGDSDKEASFNPFSKVYDEVWVAGRAGRDRYLRARVGVRDDAIVEVGRPQLADIVSIGPGLPLRTVLYAPTWEGWTDDLFHTSMVSMGPRMVKALLEHSPPLRVLYKPHPLTGNRDPRAKAAHKKIVAMIDAANEGRAATPPPSDLPNGSVAEAAATRLAALAGRIDALSAGAEHGDEAQLARDSGRPHAERDKQYDDAETEWRATYWQAEPYWKHRVIAGPRPHLYDCFNQADLLITDISSVVADFIASGKPYVVTNTSGMADEEFRQRYPSAEAAYLLGTGLTELTEILDSEDVRAAERETLRKYLLGEADAMGRFNAAVNRLAAEAEELPPPEAVHLNGGPLADE